MHILKIGVLHYLWLGALACFCQSGPLQDTLRVGIQEHPPFVMKDANGNYHGLSVELWERIAEELDMPFTYVPHADIMGILRNIHYRELDICINPVANNALRMEQYGMSQPFHISSVGAAITTSSQSQFQIFVNNFFSREFLKVVLLLGLILLSFGTILWFAERRSNKYQFRPGILGLFDGLWWAAVTMTTVGYGDKAPKSNLGKAIAIIWMFTAVIIISSFTATIASTLTVNTLEAQISDLDDLKTVEGIGAVGASDGADFLSNHQIEASNYYSSPLQGLLALSKREVAMLVGDRTTFHYLIKNNQLDGAVRLLPLEFDKQYRSFAMPKDFFLSHRINTLLIREIQKETWNAILKKYYLID